MNKFFITENQRKDMKSFKDTEQFQKTIRVYMYRFKDVFHNKNTFGRELNATGKVFKFLYKKSFNTKDNVFGVSYWSNKKIAVETGVCVRSVRRATSLLNELNIVLKVPTKRQNGSDSSNTFVILPLLKSVVDGVFNLWNTPCPPPLSSREEGFRKDVKQEKQNKEDAKLHYLLLKLEEAEKRNPEGIKFLGAYCEKMIRHTTRKALYSAIPKPPKVEYQPIGIPLIKWYEG